MKELKGLNIPNIKPTVDGSCVNDTAAAADAANRGWWTCGGHTRSTGTLVSYFEETSVNLRSDITSCPDKLTWGVRYVYPSPVRELLLSLYHDSVALTMAHPLIVCIFADTVENNTNFPFSKTI